MSETVLYSRLRDPEFKKKYEGLRVEVLEESTAAIQFHVGGAIKTLADVMNDSSASAQTRLNAAEAIIRNSLKLTEQSDILVRLKALEDARP